MAPPFKHPDKRKSANKATIRRSNEQMRSLGIKENDTRGLAALIRVLLDAYESELEQKRLNEKG